MENIQHLQPTFTERNEWKKSNLGAALVLGLIIAFVFVTTVVLLDISLVLVMALLDIFALLYCIAVFFLLQPVRIREINRAMIKTVERTVEKPIVKEVFVDRPVVREVMVDRPVVREVVVEKPVYRDVVRTVYPAKKAYMKIPKYNYLGSTQARRFHSRNCRLGKLIKRKYKVSNNSKKYFIKKGFKACKVCIKKK